VDTIQGVDCIEGMKALPTHSIDVAIADPPYNASKGNIWKWDNSVRLPGFGGDWSKVMATWDDMPLADYFQFTLAWLSQIKRVVRPTGSIWIHGTYHNIGLINFALQLLEIEIINEVVWFKRNSFPNLSGRRLTASHETILWAHTGKEREYLFNYDAAKGMACPEDSIKQPGKQMRTVWDIPNNKHREELRHGKHPTQKPVRLLKRMLALSAREGQLLLSPFAGAGSDCVAAADLGIHFLGFETDAQYADICRKRLARRAAILPLGRAEESRTPTRTIGGNDEVTWTPRDTRAIPSLVKWTGSKRSQASSIAKLMPAYRRYLEPFLGGGALLYLAARPGSVGGDIYSPLMDLWQMVQQEPEAVVDNYARQWTSLQEDLPDYYYLVRDRFNENPTPLDLSFLMRTCVNGIVRFNEDGGFNNSFHLSRKGMEPARFKAVVYAWHKVIQGVRFVCQDYAETISEARKGDFVYFDPPYAGNKQRYTEDLDLNRFFEVLADLNRREVNWALSFDGKRGEKDLTHDVPKDLYMRQLFVTSGNSAVGKVLNGPVEEVQESLYLNY
jgi:site-specific DNA-methyltransferase (adenine-specific)